MALVVNTNSYVSLVEANAYFEDRLDVAAWDSAADAEKSKALVTAALYLNDCPWIGYAVSDTQALAFPRTGIYFDPKLGIGVDLSKTTIPERVKVANYELAYHLLNNDGLLDDTGLVDELSLGNLKLKEIDEARKIPYTVKRVIKPLLVNSGSRHWWRAN